jgi:hypothetical protein
MNDLNEPDDLKRSAPTLFGLPKADPFVVPKGFFDTFPHQVQGLVTGTRRSDPTWSVWKRMAIALPVLAMFGLGLWWAVRPGAPPASLVAVTAAHLTDEELDALGDDELLALTEDVAPLVGASDGLGSVNLELNDDELLAYLEFEGADIHELITTE